MPKCKTCDELIFWAYIPEADRWTPGALESISGEEQTHDDGSGPYVLLAPHHRRHKCSPTRNFKKVGEQKPPPRVVASASFGFDELAHYATLHLLPSAPKEVVRAAHRALAAMYHPDRGGDVNRMVEINLAYDALERR